MRLPISEPQIGEEEKGAVGEVLESGFLAQGEKVERFEELFSTYIGVEHAVATSSGTTALHTLLEALDVKAGEEIITTPFTFIATANSMLYTGAKPVFADIDPRTFNLSAEEAKERITSRSRAIMVVHLYGQPCDMRAFREICEDHSLELVEDACQAHGAEYGGKKVGSFGHGTFSFYPTKNMTTGEGGMITTGDKEVAERARMLRQHGASKTYSHEYLGYNYRMTDMAAAMGIEQLAKLEGFIARRRENASMLTEGLRDIPGVEPPRVSQRVRHVFNQYTVRAEDRDGIRDLLEQKGVGTGIYYPKPLHRQKLHWREERFREAERASKEVLSLPVHPGIGEEEINYILSSLRGVSYG